VARLIEAVVEDPELQEVLRTGSEREKLAVLEKFGIGEAERAHLRKDLEQVFPLMQAASTFW
jgi:hypothetical protein